MVRTVELTGGERTEMETEPTRIESAESYGQSPTGDLLSHPLIMEALNTRVAVGPEPFDVGGTIGTCDRCGRRGPTIRGWCEACIYAQA